MVDQLFTILADMTCVMPIVKKSVKKSGAEAVAFMLEVITARGAKRRNDDIEVDPVKGWSGWNGACRETAALFMVSVSGFEPCTTGRVYLYVPFVLQHSSSRLASSNYSADEYLVTVQSSR
jgi:hypothetical protein